jgi:hypothetical protein
MRYRLVDGVPHRCLRDSRCDYVAIQGESIDGMTQATQVAAFASLSHHASVRLGNASAHTEHFPA